MTLNNIQPRPNHLIICTSIFFSKMQDLIIWRYFYSVLSNEDKKADFITIDKNNTNDFFYMKLGELIIFWLKIYQTNHY